MIRPHTILRSKLPTVPISTCIKSLSLPFPRPQFMSFDLFGTLYTPKYSVAHQYHKISSSPEFNIKKSLQSIKEEFPQVYNQLILELPNWGKGKLTECDEWWCELIARLYKLDNTDIKTKNLCEKLIKHFTTEKAYTIYDDVIPTLELLKRSNVELLVLSNSDVRIYDVLNNLGLLRFFKPDNIYLSYDIGYMKPDEMFYQYVIEDLQQRFDHFDLKRSWHIGDSYSQDFLGCIKTGWNGILLDRLIRDMQMQCDNKIMINKLSQLSTLFDLNSKNDVIFEKPVEVRDSPSYYEAQ